MRLVHICGTLSACALACTFSCGIELPSQIESHAQDITNEHDSENNGSGGGSGTHEAAELLSGSYTYTRDADSIYVQTDRNYCYGDELMTDAGAAVAYTLSGDSLYLEGVSAAGPLREALLVQDREAVILVRDGSGTDLQGTWILAAARDADGALHEPSDALGSQMLEFTDDRLYVRVSKTRAEIEFAITARLVDLDPNISVKLVSDSEVRIKGYKTGEQITIRSFDYDSVVFTSTLPGRERHVMHSSPTECPNEPAPDWFYEFFDDNSALL
jgi:hypothetical protein